MSNWTKARLDEVCSLVTDGTHHSPMNSSSGAYRYVTAKNIRPWGLDLSDISYVDEKTHAEIYVRCPVEKNDVLYIKDGATTGLAVINHLDEPFSMLSSVALLKPKRNVLEPRYLKYWLNSPETFRNLTREMTGSAIKRLVLRQIRSAEIDIAPFNEQTRIADQLDKLLARIQACNDRLDAIFALLKRFRQAVLAAATSGALTEDWRHANSIGMDSWSESSIGEFIERIDAGLNVKCVERPPEVGEIGLVKISAVTWGVFDDDQSKTLPPGTKLPELTKIRVGDFLISRANTRELVGACVIVEQVDRAVYLSDKVLRLVLPEEVKPWLLFILRSRIGRKQIEMLASGNQLSMRNLSQANLKSIRIPMPKPKERIEIARRVETLLAFADRIEARYTAARAQAQRLTPLLLAKAFRGELVQQDPQDEPASVLLARIAATKPAKIRTARGRPRIQHDRRSTVSEFDPADWAALPDGAWAAPADPDGQATLVWLTAVLRTWGEPVPEREARLAALLCQQPRLFTAVLPAAKAVQWSRLVGDEAMPLPMQLLSIQPAINSHWGRAIKGMTARGDLVEAGVDDSVTWALGPGAAGIETAGWPDGRARFVVAHLRAHGMASVLPLLEPSAQEFVDARAA